jgi:hypothetical protein
MDETLTAHAIPMRNEASMRFTKRADTRAAVGLVRRRATILVAVAAEAATNGATLRAKFWRANGGEGMG